jgi:hypothetical protein
MKIVNYQPRTRTEAIGWLIEEAVEVIHASTACFRWGGDNIHEGRTNTIILKDEIQDLKKAIEAIEKFL